MLLKQGHLKVRAEHQILKYEGMIISDDNLRLRSMPQFSEASPLQVFFTQPPTLLQETIQQNQQKPINPIPAETPVQEMIYLFSRLKYSGGPFFAPKKRQKSCKKGPLQKTGL